MITTINCVWWLLRQACSSSQFCGCMAQALWLGPPQLDKAEAVTIYQPVLLKNTRQRFNYQDLGSAVRSRQALSNTAKSWKLEWGCDTIQCCLKNSLKYLWHLWDWKLEWICHWICADYIYTVPFETTLNIVRTLIPGTRPEISPHTLSKCFVFTKQLPKLLF